VSSARRRYRPRPTAPVIAVQLAFDMPGFTYQKWGATQTCKPGDWIVHKDGGDTYTVDQASFAETYRQVGPGQFEKVTPGWAEPAAEDGEIATREGVTHYRAGDYLVANDEAGTDTYAMRKATFEAAYEPAT
jgi:hypothetical protein